MRLSGPTPAENNMADDLNRRSVLKFLDAFYSGDAAAATACCDEELDSITYAPIELFPHLGHKHGRAWVAEAIKTQQKRYSSRKYEIKFMAVDGDKVATMQFLSLTQAQRRPRRASGGRGVLHAARRPHPGAPLVLRFVRFRPAIARPDLTDSFASRRARRDEALSRPRCRFRCNVRRPAIELPALFSSRP